MAEESSACEVLNLAYPCSIDSGVDMKKFMESMLDKGLRVDLYQYLARELPDITIPQGPCHRIDDLSELVKALQEKWGFTKLEDNTQMEDDFDSFGSFAKSFGMSFYMFYSWPLSDEEKEAGEKVEEKFGFTNSVSNQYVNHLYRFLSDIRKNKPISVLCLTGHGLSLKHANTLQANPIIDDGIQTPYLTWDLGNCSTMMGMGNTSETKYTPHTVTRDASAGNVIVFHSGLLSPKWVLDQLKKRDDKKIESLVIIIVDACYSGQWATYFQQNNSLKYTKLIVQTACNGDEESYGNLFIPLWIKLQGTNLKNIQALSPPADSSDMLEQHPSLYCDPDILCRDGVCEIEENGKTFRFFSQADFFLRFYAYHANKSNAGARSRTSIIEEFMPMSSV